MLSRLQICLVMSVLLVMTASPVLSTRSNSGASSPASSIGSPDFIDVAPGAQPLPHVPAPAHHFYPYNAEHYTVRPSNRPPDSRETTQTFSPPRRPAPRPDQAGPSRPAQQGQTVVSPPRWRHYPSNPAGWTQMRFSPQRNPAAWSGHASPSQRNSPSSRHSSPSQRNSPSSRHSSPGQRNSPPSRHSPPARAHSPQWWPTPPRGHSSRPINVAPSSGTQQFPMNLPSGHVYRIPRERTGGGSKAKKVLKKIGGCFTGKGLSCG
ncbi:hypothetical protein BCV69DRAFT_279434 [Microstroma glucosiphilum]|uniref:Uncharacterized protein n=1 Tax=Pseudomicrostroma glucosiphilum TaxID=1684307 RepID=A0A316UEZ4_9BASI|nr:hypothetical protein BCV69DRAFT_279434 [Pseudomicrostroma glucosiphilum]PWN23498.1 hypothetical protein BCV69DRAFT_279434 [Pseudomicrostroma glucosiphilum]